VNAIPLLDVTRALTELGWEPRYSSIDALRALVEGWSAEPEPLTPALAEPGA
jgi:UDP-glucose 4-epimerase